MKKLETITGKSGVTYRLRAVNSGQSYVYIGQVLALNGRIVAETEPCPHGFASAALAKAKALAETL